MNTKMVRNSGLLRVAMRGLALGSGRTIRWTLMTAGLILGLGLAAAPAMSAGGIDSDADKILRSMSNYLGGLPTFKANADVDMEIIDFDGQKLQLSSSLSIAVERPGKLSVSRLGALADTEFIFDGKVLTLFSKTHNAYLQIENPGTIDDAFDIMHSEIGFDAPGADLLYADPYPIMASSVVSGDYLGTAYVNGIECHYLTFREAEVDWQLWVEVGDAPLPMKYVITTKWLTGAPQFSVRFQSWDTKPQIEADQFKFSAPQSAIKLDTIQANEMGELMIEED